MTRPLSVAELDFIDSADYEGRLNKAYELAVECSDDDFTTVDWAARVCRVDTNDLYRLINEERDFGDWR